jgi:hypothetical protein
MARTVLILLGLYIPRGNFEVRAEIVPPLGVFSTPYLRSQATADASLRMTTRRFRAWLGFARLTALIYTSHSLSKRLSSSGAAIFHAQAHIPAQPSSPLEDARISYADEDQGRPRRDFAQARQGPQAGVGEARFP